MNMKFLGVHLTAPVKVALRLDAATRSISMSANAAALIEEGLRSRQVPIISHLPEEDEPLPFEEK